jgi:hypothetical protein
MIKLIKSYIILSNYFLINTMEVLTTTVTGIPKYIFTIENNKIISVSSINANVNISIDKLYNWNILKDFIMIMTNYYFVCIIDKNELNISNDKICHLIASIKIPNILVSIIDIGCQVSTIGAYHNYLKNCTIFKSPLPFKMTIHSKDSRMGPYTSSFMF